MNFANTIIIESLFKELKFNDFYKFVLTIFKQYELKNEFEKFNAKNLDQFFIFILDKNNLLHLIEFIIPEEELTTNDKDYYLKLFNNFHNSEKLKIIYNKFTSGQININVNTEPFLIDRNRILSNRINDFNKREQIYF